MDGILERPRPRFDTSSLAGHLTTIIAARHAKAVAAGDAAEAARFDTSLDTIYFSALLLSVNGQTGAMRDGAAMLEALDAASEIMAELRGWIADAMP